MNRKLKWLQGMNCFRQVSEMRGPKAARVVQIEMPGERQKQQGRGTDKIVLYFAGAKRLCRST
jgi:hypothetical protein